MGPEAGPLARAVVETGATVAAFAVAAGVDFLLPEAVTAAGARAAAGALEWGAGSAAGYGVDCSLASDCSWDGLATSTAGGAVFGAFGGPLDVAGRVAAAGAATADVAEGGAEGAAAAGICGTGEGLSFAASTLVATPSGARAIGSLKVGDNVLAYNPGTGKSEAEPVQHVWRNHDHDLVDVRLSTTTASKTGASTNADDAQSTAKSTASKTASQLVTRLHRWVRQGAVAAGLAATLLTSTAGGATAQATAPDTNTTSASTNFSSGETIHTTANHPWLTSDRGWVPAGELRVGEQVVELGGRTATITALAVRPGAATYYNLTVSTLHTYVVGASRAVVHNTRACPQRYTVGYVL